MALKIYEMALQIRTSPYSVSNWLFDNLTFTIDSIKTPRVNCKHCFHSNIPADSHFSNDDDDDDDINEKYTDKNMHQHQFVTCIHIVYFIIQTNERTNRNKTPRLHTDRNTHPHPQA